MINKMFLLLCILLSFGANAQKYMMSGFIYDSFTHERMDSITTYMIKQKFIRRISLKLLFILILSVLPLCLMAQEDKIHLCKIKVVDAFTEEALDKAHVSVMEKDSTTLLVDSLHPRFMGVGDSKQFLGFRGDIPRREQVVLRIECKGYPIEYQALTIPTKTDGKPTTQVVFPKGIYLWQEQEQSLGEATVKASRILMVMKGDTIEYNAAAFRMHEGSMLDNLVRALPGVTLDDNGRILVNGEFVKSLLVNGRDFFNGDPRIALRNLPAYTVNKVKVYRHSEKRKYRNGKEQLSEEEKRQDPLVMDVALKREYAQGWISNYEVGGGSTLKSPADAKWMGRLFVLRYTNHSSLGIYASANNTNDGSTPGGKGEWSKMDASDGDKKTYIAGIQFSLDPKDSPLDFNTSFTANREESLFQNHTQGETFYDNSRTFQNSASESNGKSTDLKWNARLQKNDRKGFAFFEPSAYYKHNKVRSTSRDVEMQAQYNNALDTLYSREKWGHDRETAWGTNLHLYRWLTTANAGDIDFSATFKYNKQDQKRNQGDHLLYKETISSNLIEQRRFSLPEFDYHYHAYVHYDKNIRKGDFRLHSTAYLQYQQQFNSGHQDLSRTESDWLTPSAAQTWAIDELNTYHTTRLERMTTLMPQFDVNFKAVGMNLEADFSHISRRIHDFRANNDQQKNNNDFLVNPSVNLFWGYGKHHIDLGGSIKNHLPNLTYLLDVADSSDPLWHREGNSKLQKPREYALNAAYQYKERENYMRRVELRAGYSEWENSISQARFYDSSSGVTTLRPMNINGIWRAWAKGNYSRLMGKTKSWNINNTFNFSFDHSLDYLSDRGKETLSKSAVDNLNLSNNLRIDYRIRKARIGGKFDFSWTQQKSLQHRFERNTFTQFNYGLTLSTPVVWNIHIATDLMAYYRRGYRDVSMNTTDWVWNAELSCPLGNKKQWIVKAIGFDLLQQISSVRRSVNAQGWTETRYNTKPSYALFSITYRFDVKPKKKI